MLGQITSDIRFAFRQLLKNPGFTLVAVLTLALGIGTNTAIFSVINAVLLKPLPFHEPTKLLRIFESTEGTPHFPLSPADFLDYRNQNTTLSGLAVFVRDDLALSMGDHPERLAGMRISAGFFDLLGVPPILGREFRRDQEQLAVATEVIISNALWKRRFNSDPQLVGKTIQLSGSSYSVVGVMPAGLQNIGGTYRALPYGESVDIWIPLSMKPEDWRNTRGSHFTNAIGRLKPGITPQVAEAEFNIIAQRLAQLYPENKDWGIKTQSLHDEVVSQTRGTLWMLQGAVVFILLIACINLASLMLVRAVAREREMAVRSALGASTGRILRAMLVESVCLSVLGGAAGLILASVALKGLLLLAPSQLPRLQDARIDLTVLLFTLGISLLTGIVFGLAPALQNIRTDINKVLKDGGRSGTGGAGKRRVRDLLAVSEIALALIALVGAGLLLRSFIRLEHTDTGFNPDRVLTATLSLPASRYAEQPQMSAFARQFVERLEALPGVKYAALSSDLPWTGYDENAGFGIIGKSASPDGGGGGRYHRASENYFRAIGTPLVAGRFFNAGDSNTSQKVILVNRHLAERYWPDESALGKQITFKKNPKPEDLQTIVGVVGDVKDSPDSLAAKSAFYWPMSQVPSRDLTLAVQTSGDPTALVTAVRNELAKIDKDMPLADVQPLDAIAGAGVASQRFTLILTGLFALTAVTLALIGVYSVMSYLVSQRTAEVGIRMALGAQTSDVMRLILRHGLILAIAGTVVGLVSSIALSRLMSSFLFEISAIDPVTLIAVSLALAGVTFLACLIPARRAARVDPIVALRSE